MKFDVTVTMHIHAADPHTLSAINSRLGAIETLLKGTIMAKLDGLVEKVQKIEGVADSAIELIRGLRDQIANLEPTQAAIDALASEVDAKADALAAAVSTPASS